MAASIAPPTATTLADLWRQIGSVPLDRIPVPPPVGLATEADVLAVRDRERRLYELVDGVLVEKPMGYYESILAGTLIQLLRNYLDEHPMGTVLGEAGLLQLAPGLVRIPDVSFVSWDRLPGRKLPKSPILDVGLDLAVEILSAGNTEAEMTRKVGEYFAAGARLVWLVDPDTRTARVFLDPENATQVKEDEELDGGSVLPGFRVSLREWIERAGLRE
jgi:Uma2 family endonuclease